MRWVIGLLPLIGYGVGLDYSYRLSRFHVRFYSWMLTWIMDAASLALLIGSRLVVVSRMWRVYRDFDRRV